MTMTADRTEAEPGSVNDMLQLMEEHRDLQERYAVRLECDIELQAQHALEVARARSEVIQQVSAQVLSVGVPVADAQALLGPFWREPT